MIEGGISFLKKVIEGILEISTESPIFIETKQSLSKIDFFEEKNLPEFFSEMVKISENEKLNNVEKLEYILARFSMELRELFEAYELLITSLVHMGIENNCLKEKLKRGLEKEQVALIKYDMLKSITKIMLRKKEDSK